MFGKIIAGVSFDDTTAQLAVLEIKKHSTKLRYLQEYGKGSENELWFLDELLAAEERIVRKVSKVSIALDNSAVVVHNFPLDRVLPQNEQHELVEWELSNFIPDYKTEDFDCDIRSLRSDEADNIAEVFVIASRRPFLEQIKATLWGNKVELCATDTAHFGAQNALKVNYPEVETKVVALVAVTQNRIDVGFLREGHLFSYHYALLASVNDILEYLQRHFQLYTVSDIYFCGGSLTNALINATRGRFAVNVTKLNPFRQLRIASSFRNFASFTGQEHRFAAAVGCALRQQ